MCQFATDSLPLKTNSVGCVLLVLNVSCTSLWCSSFMALLSVWSADGNWSHFWDGETQRRPQSFSLLLSYATIVTFTAAFCSVKNWYLYWNRSFNVLRLYICVKILVLPPLVNTDADNWTEQVFLLVCVRVCVHFIFSVCGFFLTCLCVACNASEQIYIKIHIGARRRKYI